MDNILLEKNKEYVYVISYYQTYGTELKNTDISIFEIDEWEKILEIEKIFDEYKTKIFNQDINIIDIRARHAAYYLNDECPYTIYGKFSNLEYHYANDKEIYKRVFIETKNEDRNNISIDKLRDWFNINSEEIENNINIISLYS